MCICKMKANERHIFLLFFCSLLGLTVAVVEMKAKAEAIKIQMINETDSQC